MRWIAVVLAGAVLAGCGAEERAAAPDPAAADKRAILALVTGRTRVSRPQDLCRRFTAKLRREVTKDWDARDCEDAMVPGPHGHRIATPATNVPIDVRVHEAHAEVTLAPGRYYVRPLVVRLVRERGRWLIDAWKFPPMTQVGDCFMDVSGQYLDGDWKWPQVTDATVAEYVDRVCTRAVAEHVYEGKGHRAAWGRINRAVFLAMCREGKIKLRD